MKRLPTGVENFKEIIKGGYYYVDKTLLVKDVINLSGKIKLITRPRRFGKTLNMDMLMRFFSMDEKENLFEGLNIWKEKEIVGAHYHKYPVIYITFKGLRENCWEKALEGMKNLIIELAKDMKRYVNDEDDEYYMEKIIKKEATEVEYSLFLRHISKMIYRKVGIHPVILIDEYDVPIESAYLNKSKDGNYYDNMIDFMRSFLTTALKGSDTYFSFAVLTGVYRIAKESIFSGLNNLVVYTIFDNEMADKYGFTEEEVVEMIKHYALTEEDKKIIDNWYGKYRMGNVENLYNPWSVINYVAKRIQGNLSAEDAAQSYWVNTSSNDLIIEQIQNSRDIKEKLHLLINRESIQLTINPHLSLRELEEDETGVWVLFASSGYLSVERVKRRRYAFRIPNEEILEFFKESVQTWIRRKTKLEIRRMYDALDDMLQNGDYDEFKEMLEEFLSTGLSYYDVARDESERFYKGFLLGMLAIAVNGYRVESEMESGYGRLDIVIYPKEKMYGQYCAIFEVKRVDDRSKLENLAKEALFQIKEHKYYKKMKNLGYKVIGFGIAFCGKRSEVKVEEL